MKRFIPLLALALAACAQDIAAPSQPSNGSEGAVALLTATYSAPQHPGALVYYGNTAVNTNAFDFGQIFASYSNMDIPPVVLSKGETTNIIFAVSGAAGLESDGKSKPTQNLMFDIKETSSAPGVVLTKNADLYFRITQFRRNCAGNCIGKDSLVHTTISGTKFTYPITMSTDTTYGYFVFPAIRYGVGCEGDATKTISSDHGVVISRTDRFGSNANTLEVGSVTFSCTMYPSAAAAMRAMPVPVFMKPNLMTTPKPVVTRDAQGRRWMTLR